MKQPRLATNKQKIMLEIVTDGKCEVCGKPAVDVHHIKPFSQGGETKLHNLQYVCKECHLDMHKTKNEETEVFRPLMGQSESWEKIPKSSDKYDLIKMPTGYGKTFTGIGAFIEMEQLGLVNRALVVVSSKIQVKQWVDDINTCGWWTRQAFHPNKYGFKKYRAATCENARWLIRQARTTDSEKVIHFFVATYQLINMDRANIYEELTSLGSWLLFCDEAHHLAGGENPEESNQWSKFLDNIEFKKAIYLSATPHRNDRVELKGVKYQDIGNGLRQAIPLVEVTYKQAFREKALRHPIGHNQHYFVGIDTNEGFQRITTEWLRERGYKSFEQYEESIYQKTKRGLRYSNQYVSTMVLDGIEMLAQLNELHPGQNQMLVWAMTCDHAEYLSNLINELTHPGFSDWIGTSEKRPPEQNDSILTKYKEKKLPCLVNVNKANEGFNHKNTSVVLFLNISQSSPLIQQQLGRGLRRNRDIKNYNADVCHIFTSADTDVALEIEKLENEFLDAFKPIDHREGAGGGGGGGVDETTEDIVVVEATFYKQDDIYLSSYIKIPDEYYPAINAIKLIPDPEFNWASKTEEEIYLWLTQKQSRSSTEESSVDPKDEREECRKEANRLLKKITGLVIKLFTHKSDGAFSVPEYRELKDDAHKNTKRRVNKKWVEINNGNGVRDNTPDELRDRVKFLETVIRKLEEGDCPQWLRPQLS